MEERNEDEVNNGEGILTSLPHSIILVPFLHSSFLFHSGMEKEWRNEKGIRQWRNGGCIQEWIKKTALLSFIRWIKKTAFLSFIHSSSIQGLTRNSLHPPSVEEWRMSGGKQGGGSEQCRRNHYIPPPINHSRSLPPYLFHSGFDKE